MIQLTHLNGQRFYLNPDLLLLLEETPDTLAVTTTGQRILIKETCAEVVDRMVALRRRAIDREVALNIVHHQPPAEPADEADEE